MSEIRRILSDLIDIIRSMLAISEQQDTRMNDLEARVRRIEQREQP